MVSCRWVITMENDEKHCAVRRMKEFLQEHRNEDIVLEDIARAARYSPWHALRAFAAETGRTPMAYLRSLRLYEAAVRLGESEDSVLGIALGASFGSHEGFTKAFAREYAMSPSEFRRRTPPKAVNGRVHALSNREGVNNMSNIIFTQVVERPARKMILKRGSMATHYFEYCEEVGCHVHEILGRIDGALYEPVGIWLPENMRPVGTSEYCAALEMPVDYAGPVPSGFDIIDLPACMYLVFHGEPYADDEDYGEAISVVWEAIERFDPVRVGWEWAPDAAPRFQYAPYAERGYIEGRPVRKLQNDK